MRLTATMVTSTPATLSEQARRAQRSAADPTASVWVAANAGTGKTQVLTDRLLRLLLSGTRPERILALTYTKAAAAEMATRVFDRLSAWVTEPLVKLDRQLRNLLGRDPTDAERATARRLFAVAIETPGGLKVQTIHGFAERLLQRFPLEAGVSPGFQILDDQTAAELRRAATDAVLLDAAADPGGPLGRALAVMVAHAADEQFDAVLRDALARRDWLVGASRLAAIGALEAEYRRRLGLAPDQTRDAVVAALAGVLADADLDAIHAVLAAGSTNEKKLAPAFRAARAAPSPSARIEALADALLTAAGTPRKSLFVKASATAHPHLVALIDQAQSTFVRLKDQRHAFDLLEATLAVATLADAVSTGYARAKAARAALDFDDLIRKAESLLAPAGGSTGAAAWVLYKLDGGLDHILVDEAQDTSRPQWGLIEALAAEFFADTSATARTVFAVGDEKQSIYRFQGAAPELLAEKGRAFELQAAAAGATFRHVPLDVSFRTTQAVLTAVDRVFADPASTPGVATSAEPIRHLAHRVGQAGLVEVWPVDRPDDVDSGDPWVPVAEAAAASPAERLAARIADTIATWIASGERLASQDRPITPGDILILVGRRRPFAPVMVAALERRGIPVAGADRMVLTEQLVVEDLLALADVLVLPEDDLALASVLKSPIFGLDDDDLLRLTAGEDGGSLWRRLLSRAETDARFAPAADLLRAWRSQADFRPPYEFFATLLDADQGAVRRRLISHLGIEAADPIDAFLDLTLAYDETEAPSLQGFLTWVRAGGREVKRDLDQGRNEVRVMTVHGAKGLEAPIVVLPDTCAHPARRAGALVPMTTDAPLAVDALMLWPVKGTSHLPAVEAATAAEADLDQAERHRLLYVALTRPRDRLYVAGFANVKDPPPGCWYDLVTTALAPHLVEVTLPDGRTVRRLVSAQTAPPEASRRPVTGAASAEPLPAWASMRPPRDRTLTIPLAPSRLAPLDTDADGEPIEPAPGPRREPPQLPPGVAADTRRFLRGTLTHALLEHLPNLPAETWPVAAARFVAARGDALPETVRAGIVAETLAILRDATFAPLFGPESQAEVPLVALITRPSGQGAPIRITGQLDRLAVVGDRVLILDYKTNRPPPTDRADVPLTYRLQLAAYRLAVRAIYPGKTVSAAILWTDGARLMDIPSADLDAVEPQLWDAV
jgi:ATP-dependent helicase/nuclease subunit A